MRRKSRGTARRPICTLRASGIQGEKVVMEFLDGPQEVDVLRPRHVGSLLSRRASWSRVGGRRQGRGQDA